MLRKCLAVVLILGVLFVIGCAAHVHKIGNGAQGNEIKVARQWYVFFGLAPINEVDTNTMAGTATDYEIVTQQTVSDFILNLITGFVTVNSRKVIVRK